MIKTVIIADNLVNDYCGLRDRYLQKNVHIGPIVAERLFGRVDLDEAGPVPIFLHRMHEEPATNLLFLRDYYDLDASANTEQLERLGNHCLKGSSGEDFVPAIRDLVSPENTINDQGLSFPFEGLREALCSFIGLDLTDFNTSKNRNSEVRFLLIGFHTERRLFTIANVLRNLFEFQQVSVFSHFMASANKDAHFAALQYQYPDNLIKVLNCTSDLASFLGIDLSFLDPFNLTAVQIKPDSIRSRLNAFQVDIIESICMHWTEARLKRLNSGYSNSVLFLAHGKQGISKTEPMVIKIDDHFPIRLEIKGYNLVKDFLGKHVPTLTFPVNSGPFSGIGMELASMEGSPLTLQDHLERAKDDHDLGAFLNMLDRVLTLLNDRVYSNTKIERMIAPYRHFKLHLEQHAKWLKANIENIQKHPTEHVSIAGEAILKIFDAVRKNSDVLIGELCIAHGDLNLANILSDDKGNLWTIDWTHTDMHPIAIDFAKLENDVKFVLSKDMEDEDLPKLQLLEDYLLHHRIPAPIEELPESLRFVLWDIRFKKIYLPVREFRLAYGRLQGDQEWLVYKIALLRYALHTLSFDKSLNQGECKPVQLWYALLSVEILMFLLVGDDFHLRIRSEKPRAYPERFRIPIDMASWQTDCPDYDPPYYVSQEVVEQDRLSNPAGEADPEVEWVYPDLVEWGRDFSRAPDGKPLNPSGRTGIEGRGSLWLWGSNPMLFFCPIFYNKETKQLECLINTDKKESDIISIHFRRSETFQHALDRASEKIKVPIEDHYSKMLFEGYFYDLRQTDNAWIDARAFLVFLRDEAAIKACNQGGLQWKPIKHQLINSLHPSYANLLRSALLHLFDEGIHQDEHIIDILEKSG